MRVTFDEEKRRWTLNDRDLDFLDTPNGLTISLPERNCPLAEKSSVRQTVHLYQARSAAQRQSQKAGNAQA